MKNNSTCKRTSKQYRIKLHIPLFRLTFTYIHIFIYILNFTHLYPKTAPVHHELNLSRFCSPIPLFYARSVRGNRRIGFSSCSESGHNVFVTVYLFSTTVGQLDRKGSNIESDEMERQKKGITRATLKIYGGWIGRIYKRLTRDFA